jgi:hypothetical protein
MVNLRRLLLSCIVGLVIIAAIGGFSVWYWNQTAFSAVAHVRVLENPPQITFATTSEPIEYTALGPQDAIDVYAKSSAVIEGALAIPGVGQVLAQEPDPAAFIRNTLEVEKLGESEVWAFRMTGRKQDMGRYQVVVDAVAQSLVKCLPAEELARRAEVIETLGKEIERAKKDLEEIRSQVEALATAVDDPTSKQATLALEVKKDELMRAQGLYDVLMKRFALVRQAADAPTRVFKLD